MASATGGTGCIVDGGVLIPPHRPAPFPSQSQELDVYLNVVAGNLLRVSVRMDCTPAHAIREFVQAVPLADSIDCRIGGLDVVISL
jgi:hypothetical protein